MNNGKKTILYVITQSEWGGAQRYIYDLASSEQVKNLAVNVAFGENSSNTLSNKMKALGVKIWPLKRLVRPISPVNDVLAVFELAKLYRQLKPDVIHLNSSKAGIIGSLASFLYRRRDGACPVSTIYTVHGWVFNEPMSPLKKQLYIFLERFTTKFKSKIICVSEFDRQVALKYKIAPAGKLITIHNGIDTEAMEFLSKEEARNELGIMNDGLVIGTIANFYPAKGLEYLIEAFNILIRDYQLPATNYKLIIIGDGELRPQLEKLIAEKNLKDKVFLVGKKENASKYLKAFDVYVCSSVKEGFPYSILEAMAAELPIVATEVGGIPEIIEDGETGILVEPKNSANLAERMKYLIDSKNTIGDTEIKMKQKIKINFSLKLMAEKTFDEY